MRGDPFGNLDEWGRVIAHLRDLIAKNRQLDEVQAGLVRLIRYPGNWRIREHALIAAGLVESPTLLLVAAVADVLSDHNVPTDARILAANTLGDFAGRTGTARAQDSVDPEEVLGMLKEQLATPSVPVLHRAVEEAAAKVTRVISAAAFSAGSQPA